MPSATHELYKQFLKQGGFPHIFAYNDTRHKEAYLYLRDRVSQHILLGGEIQLTSRPSGAAEWIAANSTHEIEVHSGNVIGQLGDNKMQLRPTNDEEEEDNINFDELEPEWNGLSSSLDKNNLSLMQEESQRMQKYNILLL